MKIKSKFNYKILAGTCLFFLMIFCFLFSASSSSAQTSPDAIAIRVIPNSKHYSPLRWYREEMKFTGAPQSLLVDGYEAIRDGRTVYVNVANISDNNFYTNIYLISYNQQAESGTLDIFGQILSHWKFNTNINENSSDKCFTPPAAPVADAKRCRIDSDCDAGQFCSGAKAKIVRDTKRLSDLAEIKIALENYKKQKGFYPKLSAGSYLPNKTISTWPSWQENFSREIGLSPLPVDPVNKLGNCGNNRFDKITCWDEKAKEFSGTVSGGNLVLPAGSKTMVYSGSDNGLKYNVCAVMESGYVTDLAQGACEGSETVSYEEIISNSLPQIICPILRGYPEKPFKGYISASDPENNKIIWDKIEPIYPSASADWTNWQWYSGNSFLKISPTTVANQRELSAAIAGKIQNYQYKVIVHDEKHSDSFTEKVCSINILADTYCGDGKIQKPNSLGVAEICDNGASNGVVCSPVYDSTCTYCKNDCSGLSTVEKTQWCGDGIKNGLEICDNGVNNGVVCLPAYDSACAYCKNDCSEIITISKPKDVSCGDGVKNGLEVCDDGADNGAYNKCKADCSGIGDYCGDGIKNGSEVCDDGSNNGKIYYCNTGCQSANYINVCTFPLIFPCTFPGDISCDAGYHLNYTKNGCTRYTEEICNTTVVTNGAYKSTWLGDAYGWSSCNVVCDVNYPNVSCNSGICVCVN
ncbi:MAG: hypothetical protein PHT51_02565 [Patescibacteria group bacterium]|nr:hypothetical protein [Patescibacteria group bacterium]